MEQRTEADWAWIGRMATCLNIGFCGGVWTGHILTGLLLGIVSGIIWTKFIPVKTKEKKKE